MTKKFLLRLAIVGLVLIAALFILNTATAKAQGGDDYPPGVDPDDVYRISRELYCDVCQGVPLADCPSTQCRAWREEIADYLAAGMTESEILDTMGQRYGEKISGIPLTENNRRFTYAIPIVLALFAAAGVIFQIRRMRDKDHATSGPAVAARSAGLLEEHDRPVPDNVDPIYLERLLNLLNEEK